MLRNTLQEFTWEIIDPITLYTPASSYTAGKPAGTYEPGLDYAIDDNVSKFGQIIYGMKVNFSHSTDPTQGGFSEIQLDNIALVLVDPVTNQEMTTCPVYRRDTTTLTTTGANYDFRSASTEVGNLTSLSKGVQLYGMLDPIVGNLGRLAIPWNAKIEPYMKAVGYVNNKAVIETKPQVIKWKNTGIPNQDDMLISSKARIAVQIDDKNYQGGYSLVEYEPGVWGVYVEFDIHIDLADATGADIQPCHRATDYPSFSTINLQYIMTSQFFSRNPIELVDIASANGLYENFRTNVNNNILQIQADRVNQNDTGIDHLRIKLFVPAPAQQDQASYLVTVTPVPDANNGLIIDQFINTNIFQQSHTGKINRQIQLVNQQYSQITEWIDEINETTLEQTLKLIGNDIYIGNRTKMLVLLKDVVRYFEPKAITPMITYTERDTGATINPPLNNLFTVKYGYANFANLGLTVNQVAEGILADNGVVQLYAPSEAATKDFLYNAMVIEFTGDPRPSGGNYLQVDYLSQLNNIEYYTNTQFETAHGISFAQWYGEQSQLGTVSTGRTYSYIQLSTVYADEVTAEGIYAGLLPSIDKFVQATDNVDLQLGCTDDNDGKVLRTELENKTQYRLGVPNMGIKLALNVVQEYSPGKFAYVDQIVDFNKVYYLAVENKSNSIDFTQITIPAHPAEQAGNPLPGGDSSTEIVIKLDENLTEHLFDSGKYFIYRPNDTAPRVILDYDNDFGDTIIIPIKKDLTLGLNEGIYIPVKFFVNNQQNLVVNKTFNITPYVQSGVTSVPRVVIADGFATGMTDLTQYVKLTYINSPTGLSLSWGNEIGLSVAPHLYYPMGLLSPTDPTLRDNYWYGVNIINYNTTNDEKLIVAIPVPTDEYNMSQNSNNTVKAAITGVQWSIEPDNCYYLKDDVAAGVKSAAIAQMQSLNGTPNLQGYMATVQTDWNALTLNPGDGIVNPLYLQGTADNIVILLLEYSTTTVGAGDHLRIYFTVDYDDVPYPNVPQQLVNAGVVKYYNDITAIEAASNEIRVERELIEEPDAPVMGVVQASQYKLAGSPLDYSIAFGVPDDLKNYDHISIEVPAQQYVVLDSTTVVVKDAAGNSLTATVDYQVDATVPQKQLVVTFPVDKLVAYHGTQLTISYTSKLDSSIATQLSVSETTSSASLLVYGQNSAINAIYTIPSNSVSTVLLVFNDISLMKLSAQDEVYRMVNEVINYTLTFTLPSADKGYTEMVITDQLPASLEYVSSSISYSDEAIPGTNQGRDVSFKLVNISNHPGEVVRVTIAAKIVDISEIERSRVGTEDQYYIDNQGAFTLTQGSGATAAEIGPIYSNVARVFGIEACVVNAYHVDQETQQVLAIVGYQGEAGTPYQTHSSDALADYYQLVDVVGNPEGVFTDEPQTVVYYYIKQPVSLVCKVNGTLSYEDQTNILVRMNDQGVVANTSFTVPNYDSITAIKFRYLLPEYLMFNASEVKVMINNIDDSTYVVALSDVIVRPGEFTGTSYTGAEVETALDASPVRFKQVEIDFVSLADLRGDTINISVLAKIEDATKINYRVTGSEKIYYVSAIAQLEFNGDGTEGPTCYSEAIALDPSVIVLEFIDIANDIPIIVNGRTNLTFTGIPGGKLSITGTEPELSIDGYEYLGFKEDGSVTEAEFIYPLGDDLVAMVYYRQIETFTVEADVSQIMYSVGQKVRYTATFNLPNLAIEEAVQYTDVVSSFLSIINSGSVIIADRPVITIANNVVTPGSAPTDVKLEISNDGKAITCILPFGVGNNAAPGSEVTISYTVVVDSLVGIPYVYVKQNKVHYIENDGSKQLFDNGIPTGTIDISYPVSMVYMLEPGSVTVRFVDYDTNEQIAPSITAYGLPGEAYDIEAIVGPVSPVDLTNYDVKSIPDRLTGEYATEDQVYVYYYVKKDINLRFSANPTVVAKLNGQTIVYTAQFNTPAEVYEVDQLEVEVFLDDHIAVVNQAVNVAGATRKPLDGDRVGYSLSNLNGSYNQPVTVTVTASVTDASLIGARENMNGEVEYFIETSVAVTFGNYRFTDMVDVLTEEPGVVYAQFIDQDTRDFVRETENYYGKLGTPYSIYGPVGPGIEGYVFKSLDGQYQGVYAQDPASVFYYYEKVGISLTLSSTPATVNRLVGEEFNIIMEFDIPEPVWNYSQFNVSCKVPTYLTLLNTVSIVVDQSVTVEDQTVGNTANYQFSNYSGLPSNKRGVKINIPVTINDISAIPTYKIGSVDQYYIELTGILSFPDGKEVSDDYTVGVMEPALVIQYYLDQKSGKPVTPAKVLEGKVGEQYNAENNPVVAISGYIFDHSTNNTVGLFATNAISVVHYYQKAPLTIRKVAQEDNVVLLNGQQIDFVISLTTPAYNLQDGYTNVVVIDEIPKYLKLTGSEINAGGLPVKDNSDYRDNRIEYVIGGLNNPQNLPIPITITVYTIIGNSKEIPVDSSGNAYVDNMTIAVLNEKVIVESDNVLVNTIDPAKVVIQYQLQEGEYVDIRPADELEGLIGGVYDTAPLVEKAMKDMDGFTLVEIPSNATGVFKSDQIYVTYLYTYELD